MKNFFLELPEPVILPSSRVTALQIVVEHLNLCTDTVVRESKKNTIKQRGEDIWGILWQRSSFNGTKEDTQLLCIARLIEEFAFGWIHPSQVQRDSIEKFLSTLPEQNRQCLEYTCMLMTPKSSSLR